MPDTGAQTTDTLLRQVLRRMARLEELMVHIKAGQDAMTEALREEPEDPLPQITLEGDEAGSARDQSQSLDEG